MTAETKRNLQTNTPAGVSLLTKALRADGAFALFSGLILLLGANPLADLFELFQATALILLGVVLLSYAAMLFFFAGRNLEQAGARLAIILNLTWVIVSYAGLLSGWFPVNSAGKWAIALVAEAVMIFAIVEFIALRRATKEVVG
ncbi:MAG TPA: hypothetical protein VMZ24_03150 [Patescibacteria group bacterium]|nr:hypothetical protein [Patescibacteria group bacterium]